MIRIWTPPVVRATLSQRLREVRGGPQRFQVPMAKYTPASRLECRVRNAMRLKGAKAIRKQCDANASSPSWLRSKQGTLNMTRQDIPCHMC